VHSTEQRTVTDDPAIAFIREIVRSAISHVYYHERALIKAYSDLGFAKEMMKRGDFDENLECSDDDDDVVFENVTQFAGAILATRRASVEYHEAALKASHAKLAAVKIMLARGGYTEIDISEIDAAVRDRMESGHA